MTRKTKLIKNVTLLLLLFFLFITQTELSFSPLAAHRRSEWTSHYGPSEVIHIEDIPGGKLILGKYDKWFSCNTVSRVMLFFWYPGGQATGRQNDPAQALVFSASGNTKGSRLYGIVNDRNIKRVEITLFNGTSFSTTQFYDDDMFLFNWKANDEGGKYVMFVRGYDAEDKVVFEKKLH